MHEHSSRSWQFGWVVRLAFLMLMLPMAGTAAAAGDPIGVQVTLEGCRNNGTIALPDGAGAFVCPDGAYTTGNLGKGWNELDLVPHRLTLDAGTSAPAVQTYSLAVAVDSRDADKPGYDVMSPLVRNSLLSTGSCDISVSGQTALTPGIGGTDTTLYRVLTVTQAENTTCVFDFYARLGLGSHEYPGSSLHANALNQQLGTAGIGARDVSIPVREILPQELRKTMSASADADVQWSLTKTADPLSVNFGDVCAAPGQAQSRQVTFRVTWTRGETTPSGVSFVTEIYARNPAARTITVSVTDRVYQGSTQSTLLAELNSGEVDVPANSESLVLRHEGTLGAGAGSLGDVLNDVATATYIDKITGIPVPGTTTASATAVIGEGALNNSFAAIGDSESISGTGLSFSVAAPTLGSFVGYTAGSTTTGPVDWGVTGQTTSGHVDFTKTIRLDTSRVTVGTLTDTAVLLAYNPPDTPGLPLGGATVTATAGPVDVSITSAASVSLTISKTIPPFLDPGESIEVRFRVSRGADPTYQRDITMSFAPGVTTQIETLDGLVPDSYTVTELSSIFYAAPGAAGVDANLTPIGGTQRSVVLTAGADGVFQSTECAGTATFVNALKAGKATAAVLKITDPIVGASDPDALWVFTLSGPGLPPSGVSATATAGGPSVPFPVELADGSYVVTETLKPGWRLTNAAPGDGQSCRFTVDFPEDDGKAFQCTFNNQRLARAAVLKTVTGAPPSASQSFEFTLRQGATSTSHGTILETLVANAGNGGNLSFVTWLVPGDHYQLCEVVAAGWSSTIGGFSVVPVPGDDNSVTCVDFTAMPGQTRTFAIDNSPPPEGDARTIGYWKNHASCKASGGRQAPTLDLTLAMAPVISDSVHGTSHASLPGIVVSAYQKGVPLVYPVFGNTYYLVLHGNTAAASVAPDCSLAAALLDKSRIDNGRKAASDPAFNLAAQLVAAQLNYAAGAIKPDGITRAISEAVQLLGSVSFNGSTHGAISKAVASRMNDLARLLDDYNNNR